MKQNTALTGLPFNETFQKELAAHGFITLQQLLDLSFTDLMQMEWFNSLLMEELYAFMKSEKLKKEEG